MNTLRWWVTLGVTTIVFLSTLSFSVRYQQVVTEWLIQSPTAPTAQQPAAAARLATLRASMTWRIVGLTIGTGFFTFLMVGLWTRALAAAADAATRIAHTDLSLHSLDVPRRDSELRQLVEAFNTLMDRLRGLHSAQQRFVADAAHELRTPLTILRGEIQVALRKDRDPEKYRAVLQSNLEEVIRLSELVEALLTLARLDAHQLSHDPTPLPVVSLCREIAVKLTPIAERKGVRIEVDAPSPDQPSIAGSGAALHRILLNLVDNAIRYSSADDRVRIAVQTSASHTKIQVIDEGTGIAAEHLPHIFERFYRIESARNRASGGAGLGLAIVKALTEANGGRIAVASTLGEGTTFTLTFPRAAATMLSPGH